MSLSSDIKRIMEIFNAAKENPVSYREFEKAPLTSPETSYEREVPEDRGKSPESVFGKGHPDRRTTLFFVPSLRPRKPFRPVEAGPPGEPSAPGQGERWPALEAALSELVPVLAGARQEWPLLLFTGLSGGGGRSTLASVLSVVSARQGRPCLLIDLNETNIFQYLLMPFRREEFVRVGRTWTLYSYEPTQTPMIVVRPDLGERPGEEEAGFLERLRDEITDQASGILTVSGGPTPLLLVDAPPFSRQGLYEASLLSSLILSPVRPDLPSLVSIREMEKSFEAFEREQARYCERFYLLNRFQRDNPLHNDIYGIFRQILSRRLCPFVIPEDPAVELSLAKGASFLDTFPETPAATSMEEVSRWIVSRLER
jgi:cellulose biosynthesis protein BcsQ